MKRKVLLLVFVLVALPWLAHGAVKGFYQIYLRGEQVVPPVKTEAGGYITLRFNPDGKSLFYRLDVVNLNNATMAHIHLAPAGKNGPPVVWLYPKEAKPQLKPGQFNGLLAQGNLTAADLIGPLKGKPLSALQKAMEAGKTYVMIHTQQHPKGELRGQIKAR